MKEKEYNKFWLAFVNLKAKKGYLFNDLIDFDENQEKLNYIGAWASIIVKSDDIKSSIDIVYDGLAEMNFEPIFIDKIENIGSMIEYDEISDNVISETDWLIENDYVFMISDKFFPYE